MSNAQSQKKLIVVAAVLAAAQLGLCVASVYAGETPGAVTISLSGSTAMRNFTTSASFTALTPGNTMTLANGFTYTAAQSDIANGIFPSVQLGANANDSVGQPANPLSNANYRAIRAEWHEQGSVEGILEMANDQIGTIGSVAASNRNPTLGNPVWINGLTGGTLSSPGSTASGYTIANSTYTNFNAAGSNLDGGQNRVQMAISDVTARQGFSSAGTVAWNRTPGQAGYGKGNNALAPTSNITGIGASGARQQLNDETVLNMSTDKIDPSTGTNYTSGAWNTAGVGNTTSKAVAVTATTFAANPGTGLTHVNRTDAQFLQATGRLANGADFNVVTRDVNSGTRNVASLNVGLDPSFSVGENDDGNTGSGTAAESNAQANIGSSIRFSGKTAGGNALRPTIQNSRMAIGHLSIGDIRSGNAAGTAANANAGQRPLRALSYRDDADDTANSSNGLIAAGFADAATGTFVAPSFATITDGSYVLYQNETYVTVKTPDANYANDKIKGDYATGDVKQFRDNILNSAGTYPVGSASFLNPANGLIAQGFIPTKYMKVRKDQDGLNQSVTNTSFDAANYSLVQSQGQSQFVVADPAAVTTGSSSTYGNVTTSAAIPITAENYLFGDFNNDGDRDFADIKTALTAQSLLAATAQGVNYNQNAGDINTQIVAGTTGALATMNGGAGATRGDLIVKGDFNSDGRFDGKDLYLLARGASLADSTSTDTLSVASGATFGDQLRNGVLRKNAALDYMNANTSAQQKIDATASVANDPAGTNAFNKFDINRDGKVNRTDAQIVDKFVGNDITNLGQQIAATIAVDGSISTSVAQRSISLVDVELQDDKTITSTLSNGSSDFKLIGDALGSQLLKGDADFSGNVNFDDLIVLAQNYNQSVDRWSKGDFTLDGVVNFDDLIPLAQNYNQSAGLGSVNDASFASDWAFAQSLVPEPTAVSAAIGGAAVAMRRRRIVR